MSNSKTNVNAYRFAGISADVKLIVDKARSFVLEHEHLYDEECKIERLLEYLGDLSLNFDDENNRIFSRPFGVSILIIGYDDQPRLYSLDPSGSYIEYKTKAIGSGNEVVENLLENKYKTFTDFDTTLRGAINLMKDVMKEKISNNNVEVMAINKEGIYVLQPEQLNEYFD
ncbi:proteasome subunit alpha type-5 [Vairimorpha apis BRL 01]|uniref:Proteasome subunit alpha type-5 n=1 Tax=Vairimorpha apis BRL 01 TaxID=1037528 RepID=T0L7Y4_9MICR|nr:proteasome subunit alpha type-5 [Vairimorpha apis BRL 01]